MNEKRFYCDNYGEYRDYAIFDTSKCEKTKEDFYDEKEEMYDIYAFYDYLLDNDCILVSDNVEDLLNSLNSENRELRQVNNDFEKLFSETISIADTSQLLENGNYDIKRMFVKELVDSLMSENEQLRQTVQDYADHNGELEFEFKKCREKNKELQDKIDWLCEQTGYDGAKFHYIEELKEKLREKEEDERLYANEIVKLNKEAKEVLNFKTLGGDY